MPPTKTPPPHEAVPLRTTTRPLRRVKFLQGGRRSTPPTHALTNKNPCMVFVWAPQKGRRSWIDLNQGAPQHTNHLRHQFLCLRVWKGRQQWNAIISSWISIHPSIHSSIYLQLCFKKKRHQNIPLAFWRRQSVSVEALPQLMNSTSGSTNSKEPSTSGQYNSMSWRSNNVENPWMCFSSNPWGCVFLVGSWSWVRLIS